MLFTWYAVLCALAAGTTANVLSLKRSLEAGEPGNSGDTSEDTGLKAIFKRDALLDSVNLNLETGETVKSGDTSNEDLKAIFKRDNTANGTYDYDLSLSVLNTPLASV